MGTCKSPFTMWTSFVVILLSVAFKSSSARLSPSINVNQLEYAEGREVDLAKMREEAEPTATANEKSLLLLLLTGNGDISNSEQCLESGSWCWDPITYSSIGNCCDSYCNVENPMEWGYCGYPVWDYSSTTTTTSTTTSTTTITTTTFTTTTTTTTTTTAILHP